MYYPVTGGVVEIDEEDLPLISCFSWLLDRDGYACGVVPTGKKSSNTIIRMHRFLMGFPDKQVDHINRIPSDNRRDNLRIVTVRGNSNNRTDQGMWPPGVTYRKERGLFRCRFVYNGKRKSLLNYPDPISASIIYQMCFDETEEV